MLSSLVEGDGFQAAISRAEEIQSANITKIRADESKRSTHQQIIDLKERLDNEDKFLIYEISTTGLVITSSSLRVQFANDMCNENSIVSNSALYIDGCEKSLSEKGTETRLVTYHPLLKRTVWLDKLKGIGLTESGEAINLLLIAMSCMTYNKCKLASQAFLTQLEV